MKVGAPYRLPDDKREAQRRAVRLEWVTLAFMASIVAVVGLVMGSSQAMKAAWVEDMLSLVPPAAFLVAARYHGRPPDRRFPYGYRRAMSISFLIAAAAVFAFGALLLADSLFALVRAERPTLGTREILGRTVWSGWLMIGALAYSIVPPLVLGRMKLRLARELHAKTLHADAAMNKADWLTGGAGILGVLGVGLGWWWADAAAAGVIALDVTRDGVTHLRQVIADLMDRRPVTVEQEEDDPVVDRAVAALERLPWVERADIRLREQGEVLVGEAYVVPRDTARLPEKLALAGEQVRSADWRLHEVVVTAVPTLEAEPDEEEPG